jgi:hypothetical protein
MNVPESIKATQVAVDVAWRLYSSAVKVRLEDSRGNCLTFLLPDIDWRVNLPKMVPEDFSDRFASARLKQAPRRFVAPTDGSLPGLQDLCSTGLAELAVSRLMEALSVELSTDALPAFWDSISPLQNMSDGGSDQASGEELEASLLDAVQVCSALQ